MSKVNFDEALARLKQAVGVFTDREVATALGLGEKAFNARKKRGSFPIDKVYALAARKPALGLDAHWVITGESAPIAAEPLRTDFDVKLQRLKQALGMAQDQQVAEVLCMSKPAFSDRKLRDAFPDDRVYTIAATRPELRIDAAWVLSGKAGSAVPADPLTALRQFVDRAYAKGMALAERHDRQPLVWGEQEDHRTAVFGDLVETLDALAPGLGQTLFEGMYPLSSDDPDGAFGTATGGAR